MRRYLLVPRDSEKFCLEANESDWNFMFYRPAGETLVQRVLRKLELRDLERTLAIRLGLDGGLDLLDGIHAMWLSPSLYLPAMLMERLLDQSPRLKWVYLQMAGTDHLDLSIFEKRGVMVSNSGRLSSRCVAEMALACVFSHAKRLPMHFALQRRRQWKSLPTDDLHRQTVGVIGTGNIGSEVAVLCRAAGMIVVGASRDPKRFGNDSFPYHRVVHLYEEMDSLLAESDHVILALPLNEKTCGLIGTNEFRNMKPRASLVNVARGGLVDEFELCEALSSGTIGAAYIDRPSRLPPPFLSRLYRPPNLVFTHYSAANSPFLLQEAFAQFVTGFREVVRTGQAPNRVA